MAMQTAILAGGCFWCIEAVYDSLQGVARAQSGYIGGQVAEPSYKQVCAGDTGHAEAVRVTFDDAVISYADLLDIFFTIHDPTQLNRQGNDVGTQYRSALFPLNATQEAQAREALVKAQADWPARIVTTIEDGSQIFYEAEEYHQEYFARVGTSNPYCTYVVAPKVAKFRKSYADKLKA
jgi:peptide-methionine (S)-S-oxide reductase